MCCTMLLLSTRVLWRQQARVRSSRGGCAAAKVGPKVGPLLATVLEARMLQTTTV